MKTIFGQWLDGTYTHPGSFQEKIFEAYLLAGSDNQRRLEFEFSDWFVTKPKQLSMLAYRVQEIRSLLSAKIMDCTLTEARINLKRPVSLAAYDENLFQVRRFGAHVMVFTTSSEDGVVICRYLDDLSTEDLLGVLTRIGERE
jgi:hypothetical protein